MFNIFVVFSVLIPKEEKNESHSLHLGGVCDSLSSCSEHKVIMRKGLCDA